MFKVKLEIVAEINYAHREYTTSDFIFLLHEEYFVCYTHDDVILYQLTESNYNYIL